MKNVITLLLISIMVMLSITSCWDKKPPVAPMADLKTDVDSLSYALGLSGTLSLDSYLSQLGIDSTAIPSLIKGYNDRAHVDENDKEQLAYFIGVQLGKEVDENINQINRSTFGKDTSQALSKANYMAGFIAGALNENTKMPKENVRAYMKAKLDELRVKSMEKEYGANKKAGIRFLEENKTKAGVVTLPNGLQYKVITAGRGAVPTAKNKVRFQYRGTLIDGTEVESSYQYGVPMEFYISQMGTGWTETLTLMPAGSKWILYVPQELGYGSAEQSKIPPFSTLIYEVELLAIVQ